jgi:alpha-glucosidase (family GH31 glycosyl hydrolase)
MFICKNVRFFTGMVATASLFLASHAVADESQNVVIGNVRVEPLSGSLVRIELKGPEGFEDQNTFHIVNRNWPGTTFTVITNSDVAEIHTANYIVRVPLARVFSAIDSDGTAMTVTRIPSDITVTSPDGTELYRFDGNLTNSVWLPAPSDNPQVWSFADTPRIIPPAWELTPPPSPMTNGGWDLGNDAPDIYVFIPNGSYRQLRSDFLKLTGPSEMPPLFAFGAWDSRWYDYSEATALKQIDDYRAHKIPLDNLVVDTGWRQNASTGYQPNTNLFPDVARFLQEAHDKHVHVMFNDHPEPVSTNALDAKELDYRFDGLSGLLNDGLDVWWYDRNWMVHLVTPAPNLKKEVWGMMLYHDTTARVRPNQRPLIMANVDGIDNGVRKRPMDVTAHRFPIQWTGDIGPDYDFLRRAVENAVYSGVQSLFPYESDDLGGHVANPTPEQYIRWIEYGALSPVYRPHCTHNLERMPWAFGPEAETDARNYINMRYRLLPVFYAAAHENYETGEPLLRRLDLDFPQYAEASRNDEYLLGQYILVAPVLQGVTMPVPSDWLTTSNGQAGLQGEYFSNDSLNGAPAFTRTDANINFNWDRKSPAKGFPRTHFSARWTGTIEAPASVGEVQLSTLEDDGARVWIDGNLVIDAWGPHDSTTTMATTTLSAGVPHQIRVEYQQLEYNAHIKLLWAPVHSTEATREAWIPPGDWIDAWSGQVVSGPVMVTNGVPLDQIPMWIKRGAVLPLAPEMDYTGQKPWDTITLDIYPNPLCVLSRATLYEDDTKTTAYQRGQFRTTEIADYVTQTADKVVRVDIGAARGDFAGSIKQRAWKLRIHTPVDWPKGFGPVEIKINGQTVTPDDLSLHQLQRDANAMPFGDAAGAPDEQVFELTLPSAPVTQKQTVDIGFQLWE